MNCAMEVELTLEHSLRFVQTLLLLIDAGYQRDDVAAAREEAVRDGRIIEAARWTRSNHA